MATCLYLYLRLALGEGLFTQGALLQRGGYGSRKVLWFHMVLAVLYCTEQTLICYLTVRLAPMFVLSVK